MYAIDFEYDDELLSEYDSQHYIMCYFDFSTGTDVVSAGSNISFEKISRNEGKQYSLANTKYDECVTATFDICKDPDFYDDYVDRQIKDEEFRALMRWLNRREFLPFRAFEKELRWDAGEGAMVEVDIEPRYYNVSFNVEKIKIGEKIYGLRLTLESDSPFAYGEEITEEISFPFGGTMTNTLANESDELGYLYPDMAIVCSESGDLQLTNTFDSNPICTTLIRNCSDGEIITIKGNEQIILSSLDSHDIWKDFNWDFFKINRSLSDTVNAITSSLDCTIFFSYRPVIKDSL